MPSQSTPPSLDDGIAPSRPVAKKVGAVVALVGSGVRIAAGEQPVAELEPEVVGVGGRGVAEVAMTLLRSWSCDRLSRRVSRYTIESEGGSGLFCRPCAVIAKGLSDADIAALAEWFSAIAVGSRRRAERAAGRAQSSSLYRSPATRSSRSWRRSWRHSRSSRARSRAHLRCPLTRCHASFARSRCSLSR